MNLAGRRSKPAKYQAVSSLLSTHAPAASRIFGALGNENRLLILYYLMANEEMKVGDLVEAIGLSPSALSQHLGRLRDERLVECRKDAQTAFYRISDTRVIRLLKQL